MGQLELECITLSGSRFVGMSYTLPTAEAASFNFGGSSNYSHVAFVQSNLNPKSLLDLTWSLVSIWPRKISYISDHYSSLTCHSDPNTGVFTMMSNFSANNIPSNLKFEASTLRQPGGFQYNPKTDQWSEFGVSPGYLWGNVSATSDLFTWPGTSTLYQASIGNAVTGINFGMLPDASAAAGGAAGGSATFVNVANYTLDPTKHGYPIKLTYANNSIYHLGRFIVDRSSAEFSYFLTRIPLQSTDGQSFKLPTAELVVFDAAAIKDCQMEATKIWYSASSATLYFICWKPQYPQDRSGTGPGVMAISRFRDGDKGLELPVYVTYPSNYGMVQPIEQEQGQSSGSSVTQSNRWIYLGGIYGKQSEITPNPDGGVTPRVGDSITTYLKISEPYGFTAPSNAPDTSYKPIYTEAITAGVILGVILILIAVLFRPVRRRLPGWREKWAVFKAQTWPRWKRRIRLKLIEILREDNDTGNKKDQDEEALAGKTVISKDGGADENEFNIKMEEHSMTTLDLEGRDKILVTDDMDLSGLDSVPVMDLATGYMNGIRLEMHPRPGVVTTLAGNEGRKYSSSLPSSSDDGGSTFGGDVSSVPPRPPGHMSSSLTAASAPSLRDLEEGSSDGTPAATEAPRAPHTIQP
ncbi:hypothetical protein BGZ95_005485 [Linnemannia exigua]|uniref:Uncharacterized protein n=1 Tax=Linnemannia exigua TaxID=604196 RepID=A0AAD4DIY3_9FUNG|nr:hypothetical protein BGZ95_005485 [Linnemannia exigua]